MFELELDDPGEPVWLSLRKRIGETAPRPKIVGIGSPNALRHTCSTEMHRRGHSRGSDRHRSKGTNKRYYRHLRAAYLADFIAGVEDF